MREGIVEDELPLPFQLMEDSGCYLDGNLKFYKLAKEGSIAFFFPDIKKGEYSVVSIGLKLDIKGYLEVG